MSKLEFVNSGLNIFLDENHIIYPLFQVGSSEKKDWIRILAMGEIFVTEPFISNPMFFFWGSYHGSLITWLNDSFICVSMLCNMYSLNPKFYLLMTNTHFLCGTRIFHLTMQLKNRGSFTFKSFITGSRSHLNIQN